MAESFLPNPLILLTV